MTSDGIRGCCWGAGRLLESLGVECERGHAVEQTYQEHKAEVTRRGEVDWVKLAAIHLDRTVEVPTLW